MSSISLSGVPSSGASSPSHWTVKERLRSLTTALSGGNSLDLRYIERYFYKKDITTGEDSLYAAPELMADHSRSTGATYPNWDFRSGSVVGRLQEYARDVRRYGSYGALDEGTGTNHIRNPRGEGAVTGLLSTTGSLPTNWSISGIADADVDVLAVSTLNGWPVVRVRLNGTPTGDVVIGFEGDTQTDAANAEPWTISGGARVYAGDLTNIEALALRVTERTAAGAVVTSGQSIETPDGEHRRFFHPRTLAGGGTVAKVTGEYVLDWNGSGAIDVTLDIYAPQLEQSATPTSPILPEEGLPAFTTRATDVVTGVQTDRASGATYDSQWNYTNGGVSGELTEYLPNIPRVGAQGLLAEDASTNEIRNPRFEGAVAGVIGSGGVLPTHCTSVDGGTTVEVISVSKINGYDTLRIRISGTMAASFQLRFEANDTVAAVQDDDNVISARVRLVSGDLTNVIAVRLITTEFSSGGTNLGQNSSEPLAVDGLPRRFYYPHQTADVNAASVRPAMIIQGAGAVDLTLDIAAPQLEKRATPTSVMLPEPGTIAAATRAADSFSIDGGAWSGNSGSIYIDAVLNYGGASGVFPRLAAYGDNSNNEIAFLLSGDADIKGVTRFGSAEQSSGAVAPISGPGQPYRAAIAFAENDIAYSVNGGSQSTDNSASVDYTSPALTLGGGSSGGAEIGTAFIKSVRYWPHRLSNAELEALVA